MPFSFIILAVARSRKLPCSIPVIPLFIAWRIEAGVYAWAVVGMEPMLLQISVIAWSSAEVNWMDSRVSVGDATPPPHFSHSELSDRL